MDVFFLGAGFSKFLKNEMPLMYDLGKSIFDQKWLEDLYSSEFKLTKNIESLMSYLTEQYPWESDSEHFQKRAAFLQVSSKIAEEISSHGAKIENIPIEVIYLFKEIYKSNFPVITLNYDLLLEECFRHSMDGDHLSLCESYCAPFMPLSARSGTGVLGRYRNKQPHIYKLHGSVNWYYSGRDSYYGESILVRTEKDDFDLTRDKRQLIIPPTFAKSSYFNNETIRYLWRDASHQIQKASRLILFGYSFPNSDSAIKTMLQNCLKDGTSIIVVNPDVNVISRVKESLSRSKIIHFNDPTLFIQDYLKNRAV